jgi:hypothetical protein
MTTLDGSIRITSIKNAPRDSRLMLVVIGVTLSSVGLTIYPAVNRSQKDLMLISAVVVVCSALLLCNNIPESRGGHMVVELFACLCALNVAMAVFPLAFFLLAMSADSPSAYKEMSDYIAVAFMLALIMSPALLTYWIVKLLLLKLL